VSRIIGSLSHVVSSPLSDTTWVGRTDRALVPRRCTLDGFTSEVAAAEGLSVPDLPALSCLTVTTANSIYQILVVDPVESQVLVQGGQFFPQLTEARFIGASFGGSFLKTAWLGRGLRMEICARGQRIVTSPVDHIELRKDSSLPGPF